MLNVRYIQLTVQQVSKQQDVEDTGNDCTFTWMKLHFTML